MKKKVYIASPYTIGDHFLNVRKQIDVADILMSLGFVVYVPLLNALQNMVWPLSPETWLEHDFEWVIACDILLRLPGESFGADKEVELAKKCDIKIYFSIRDLCKAEGIKLNRKIRSKILNVEGSSK